MSFATTVRQLCLSNCVSDSVEHTTMRMVPGVRRHESSHAIAQLRPRRRLCQRNDCVRATTQTHSQHITRPVWGTCGIRVVRLSSFRRRRRDCIIAIEKNVCPPGESAKTRRRNETHRDVRAHRVAGRLWRYYCRAIRFGSKIGHAKMCVHDVRCVRWYTWTSWLAACARQFL